MDTTARRRRIQKTFDNLDGDFYNHDVSMYKETPEYVIPLAEFEVLALERLQLLRTIEHASLNGYKPFTEDWKQAIKEELSKNGLKKYVRLMGGFCSQTEQDIQARRADYLSHYILRLAYCRSEDLRRWFLSRELEWFKLKFLAQNQQGVMKFLQGNNLLYSPISNEEKENLRLELIVCSPAVTEVSIDSMEFYKLSFTEVLPLVKARKIFIKGGIAYIPSNDLIFCVQGKFRAALNEALTYYNHRLPSLDDDRLNSLLTNLHSTHTGKEYIVRNDMDNIDPANLDVYSKQHFPLCMRNIHEILRSTHHLKHFSRLQYGLFLKGIGLMYEDALEFWRQEFTKIMDSEKFQKQYLYNFKHQYGLVGNMTNYTSYSCIKIISNSVGPGEHHGCPFRHWDPVILKQRMIEYGVGSEGVDTVIDMVKNGHFQIACSKYFEYVHNQPPSTFINHPNQYFEESMDIWKEKQTKKS